VAEISSQSSPGLLARFSISSYPTIYFLAQPAAAVADSTAANVTAAGADAYAAPPRALVYEYPDSSARSLPALTAFALGGYSAGAAAGKPVPAAPGFLAQLSAELQHAYDDIAVRPTLLLALSRARHFHPIHTHARFASPCAPLFTARSACPTARLCPLHRT
jgi:hypothetical protein